MAHMIWRGAISFGLVHVPVQLYPATQSEKVGFNLLDKRTIDPIGYKQINKRTGRDVTRDNIVRGFEYEKDHYVVLSDDEIRSANPESTQTVDILAFVDAPDISFLYLDTPYFLTPDRKGEKVYALLREAMTASGKIGVASVVLHNKQHLAALIPLGPMLALNTLRWADEVRNFDEFNVPPEGMKAAGVSAKELDMAKKLIDDMSETWGPDAVSRYVSRRHHGARRAQDPGGQDRGGRRGRNAARVAQVRRHSRPVRSAAPQSWPRQGQAGHHGPQARRRRGRGSER
ncbi:Ku protein [Paraburkholderia sp. UCT70]